MILQIGSGDINHLLMGKNTKGYQNLYRKFVSISQPKYNALASPIDAARTGAILEEVYLTTLEDDYYPQVVVQSSEMNVLKSSIDFARIEGNKIVDFDELKTLWFTEFVEVIQPMKDLTPGELKAKLKKSFKSHYNQIQQQLYNTELEECNLVFLSVMSYKDDENYDRIIKPNEVIKFRVKRDQEVIDKIKARAAIFQQIKDDIESE